jgi:hypothetical protein
VREAPTIDGFFAAYQLITPVRNAATDTTLRLQLRRMLIAHFANLKENIDEQVNKAVLKRRPHMIALAIPVNWQKGMQDYYARFIHEFWTEVNRDDIIFVSESDAIFHSARKECSELKDVTDVATVDLRGSLPERKGTAAANTVCLFPAPPHLQAVKISRSLT